MHEEEGRRSKRGCDQAGGKIPKYCTQDSGAGPNRIEPLGLAGARRCRRRVPESDDRDHDQDLGPDPDDGVYDAGVGERQGPLAYGQHSGDKGHRGQPTSGTTTAQARRVGEQCDHHTDPRQEDHQRKVLDAEAQEEEGIRPVRSEGDGRLHDSKQECDLEYEAPFPVPDVD